MQKLTRISSDQNNKSCRIIHNGSNKIGFAFSDLSVIFYEIYKIQQKHLYYLRIVLQQGPWRFLFSYRNALALRISPWEERGPRNAAPGRPVGAAPAKFRPGRRRAGRGRARGGVVGVLGPIWGVGPGEGATGGGRRRRTPMVVTVELVPVRWGDQWRNQGRVELLGGLDGVLASYGRVGRSGGRARQWRRPWRAVAVGQTTARG
jgi:hypothetical protein